VGDDQRQHIELAREIARRFNSTYGEVFVEPAHVIPKVGARIMDLQDPASKMSTSYGTEAGLIYIDDDPDAIRRKLSRAETDSGREIVKAPDKPGISNLIDILAVTRGATPEEIEREFEGEGYGAFKTAVAESVVELLTPVRERYAELRPDEQTLERALADGAERARAIAQPLMAEVRSAMGIGPVGSA
jgi:tryptophanyl-tRNA synthetase